MMIYMQIIITFLTGRFRLTSPRWSASADMNQSTVKLPINAQQHHFGKDQIPGVYE
jgi:hypothetical protein